MSRVATRLSAGRLLLLAAVVVGVGMLAWAFLPEPLEVEVAPVARGPMTVTVDEDGKTRIKERYVVSSPLIGRLQRIELDPGDRVQAGRTVLAVIEPKDPDLLDLRAAAEAQARVAACDAAVGRAARELDRAEAELEHAQAKSVRVRDMYQQQTASRQELDDAVRDEQVRLQEVRASLFGLEIARFELAQAQAALLRSTPATNGHAEARIVIRAPCDGVVLRVFQESAAPVSPGTPLVEIGDPTNLEVIIDVLSSDGAMIKPGDAVSLEHWGGDAPLGGVVRLVEPAAFTKISALGVEEQRVNVIVDLVSDAQRRRGLGDAFRVDARVTIWSDANVLYVPLGALFRHADDWCVFVNQNGKARARSLKVGRMNRSQAQVLDGLAAGDQVILYPSDQLEDGVVVRRR